MTSNKILIILLNYNGKDDTLKCLSSLTQITYKKHQTIVIDNGSNDDSVSSIRSAFPHIPIFETGQNLGFAKGNNIGIKWGLEKGYEWILLLNNDTTVDKAFLDEFMKAAKEKPQAKILGSKIYLASKPNQIDHLGGYWDSFKAEFVSPDMGKQDDGISFEEMKKADYVCGASLLMHRSVPEKIGFLEANYFLFWEESDFCLRAKREGFEIWTAPKAKIWHKVSSSFSGGKPQMSYFWWRSRLLFLKRNFSDSERRQLYKRHIFPELRKIARHYLLSLFQNGLKKIALKTPSSKKSKRYKASLIGALHYSLNRFGKSPKQFN